MARREPLRDRPTFKWDDLDVLEERRDFLDFLLALAARIDKCARLRGKRQLSCLARQADLERTTVLDWLTKGRKPEPENLRAMADATDEPLPRFWVALGWTTVEELAAALRAAAPRLILSADDQAWLDLLRTRDRRERDVFRAFFARVRLIDQEPDPAPLAVPAPAADPDQT